MSNTETTATEQAAAKAANDAQLDYPVDPRLAAIVDRARTTGERPVITAEDIARARRA